MTKSARIACLCTALLWTLTACMAGPQRTVTESTVLGAGIGAGLGYAIDRSGEGAGWGALAGGLLGALGGGLIAADQQRAIDREATLQRDLAALRQYNAQLADANQQLQYRIQSIDAEIARYNRMISNQRASIQQKRSWLQEELQMASAFSLEAQEMQREYNELVGSLNLNPLPVEYLNLRNMIIERQRLADQYEASVRWGLTTL